MRCKPKSCEPRKLEIGKKVNWSDYPSLDQNGFGNGKFCYFVSCKLSELPIRDYFHTKKLEPHYETKTYNEHYKCNQRSIKNARRRGISYIIFYTRYRGKKEGYRNGYFITGLFPISAQRKVGNRIAYRSDSPIFLSVQDSLELNDKVWKKWFGEDLPKDCRNAHNLRFVAKFVERGSPALTGILNHFHKKKVKNKLDDYVKELEKHKAHIH